MVSVVVLAGFSAFSEKKDATVLAPTQEAPASQPEELGKVQWSRDLDAGFEQSKASGKPMLILFQEVPGCSNCTRYGNNTLSHPLIVEAIESFFVPVCIYNNKGGKDAGALRRFDEPAWNNPVVRIVNSEGKDVVLRMSNFNSSAQLVNGMRRALEAGGSVIPAWMELLEEELSAREAGLKTATFSMYCFWSGEGTFGNIPGVVETEAGFQNGKEVVRVQYNPSKITEKELESLTKPKGIAACAKNEGFRLDREPKYYLAQTDYRFVPMTSLQASRVNSALGQRGDADAFLSPRQLDLLKKFQKQSRGRGKNMIGRQDLAKAWEEAQG
ncbi:MAG: thioredoxin family protein [Saprospiraceae bacterium]|nr:thioredoxin family protein [Saprospiraceae bacterium]